MVGASRARRTGSPAADGIAITYGSFDCRTRPEIHVANLDRQLRRLRDTTLGEGFLAVPAYDRGTDTLWVCWYATTDKVHMRYSCTPSHDSGRSFEKPRAAASLDSDETGPLAAHGYGGREYGDYEGLAVSHGVAHAFWTDSRDLAELGEEVYTTTLREW